jgi:hypothetical protein
MLEEKIISATIEEGDDITAVTFFEAKSQKKGKFAISLQQSEEGGDSCTRRKVDFFDWSLQPWTSCKHF